MKFFNDWVGALRGRWSSLAELPRVSAPIAEMGDGLVDTWRDLCNGRTLAIPPHDPFDPTQRFVVLNALYRLSHMSFPNDWPEEADAARAAARGLYCEAAEILTPSDLTSPEAVRWEVEAAANGHLWSRVRSLFDRWRDLRPGDSAAIEGLRGRVLWLSLRPEPASPHWANEGLWLPGRDADARFYSEHTALARAVETPLSDRTGTDGPAISPHAQERLVDAVASLEKAVDGGITGVVNTAVLAACRYLLGRNRDDAYLLSKAADDYASLTSHKTWSPDGDGVMDSLLPVGQLYEAAVICLKRAQLFKRAELLSREWLHRSGTSPVIWEHLAEAQLKQNDVHGASKSIVLAIASNEQYDADWKASLLVGLATRPDPLAAFEAFFETERARNPSVAELAEALTARYWPPFRNLSTFTQTHWINAVRLFHDPLIARELGDARLRSSGHAFGLVVEHELKTRVFDPFLKANPWVATEEGRDANGAALCKYASLGPRGYLGLGQMAGLIRGCHRPRVRRDEGVRVEPVAPDEGSADRVLVELDRWIGAKARPLLHLSEQLERLAWHRNEADHAPKTQSETGGTFRLETLRDLETLAETILQVLAEVPSEA